jgi:hypothetical protein
MARDCKLGQIVPADLGAQCCSRFGGLRTTVPAFDDLLGPELDQHGMPALPASAPAMLRLRH